jgi:hypothetical protein
MARHLSFPTVTSSAICQLPTLMLLTRSLPPHFLLPAWGMPQLLRALQRAHQSTSTGLEESDRAKLELKERRKREAIPPIRKASRTTQGEAPAIKNLLTVHANLPTVRRTTNTTPHWRRPAWAERRLRAGASKNTTSRPSSTRKSQKEDLRPVKKQPACSGVEESKLIEATLQSSRPLEQWSGSLFDEIFPEESQMTKEKKNEEKDVDKLPAFDWGAGPRMDWEETIKKSAEERKNWFHTIPKANAQVQSELAEKRMEKNVGVLVLSSASKTLEQSDFFRLGEKGEHIEGWTSGIVKGKTIYYEQP